MSKSPTKKSNLKLADSEQCRVEILDLAPIRNLVFQGGSVKGTAYGGAVGGIQAAFKEKGMNFDIRIENVAGTSAGAITALALSLGTGVAELVDTIGNTDFKSFLDTKAYEIVSNISSETSSIPAKTSAAMNTLPLLNSSFGLACGQNILDYLEAFVRLKTSISFLTFGELHALVMSDREEMRKGKKSQNLRKDLFVVAYNLTLDTPQVFSHIDTPDTIISDAVRCSMSIPYVFVPHKNYVKKHLDDCEDDPIRIEASEDLWIDGGITDNYPIWVFDKLLKSTHNATLGFYLVSEEEKREIEGGHPSAAPTVPIRREIKNILDYTKAVIETVISSQQTSAHKQSRDIGRTIYIDHLGTNMMNFGLTIEEKNELVRSGWDCAVGRCGLLKEVGKCPVLIGSKDKEVVAEAEAIKQNKKKESDFRGKFDKYVDKRMDKLKGGVVCGYDNRGGGGGSNGDEDDDSGPPSPDLDVATDTSPKCAIM